MLQLFKNWYNRHFSQPGTVEFALVLICCFLIVYYLMWLVGPIVIALCLAYLLDYFVVLLNNKFNISRKLGSSIVMLVFIVLSILVLLLIVPQVVRQAAGFYNTIVALGTGVNETIQTEQVPHDQAGGIDAVIADNLYGIVLSLPEPIPSMFSLDDIKGYVTNSRTSAMVFIADIMRNNIMPSVVNAVTYLLYMIVVPIFAFLMLYDKERLQGIIRKYVLPINQTILDQFWPSMNQSLKSYIGGKIIHIIVIAIVNTAVFKLFGLNYSVLLGLGMGFSVVIPYVGAALVAIPVLSIAVIQYGFTSMLMWLVIAYVVVLLLDAYVLTPILFSKASNLDAFSILTAIMIFGGLWGFWGVFFSIPLATVVKTLITQWPTNDPKKLATLKRRIHSKEQAQAALPEAPAHPEPAAAPAAAQAQPAPAKTLSARGAKQAQAEQPKPQQPHAEPAQHQQAPAQQPQAQPQAQAQPQQSEQPQAQPQAAPARQPQAAPAAQPAQAAPADR